MTEIIENVKVFAQDADTEAAADRALTIPSKTAELKITQLVLYVEFTVEIPGMYSAEYVKFTGQLGTLLARCYVKLMLDRYLIDYVSEIHRSNKYLTCYYRCGGRTHGAPFRGYGYVPLRNGGNVVTRIGTQQQLQVCRITSV